MMILLKKTVSLMLAWVLLISAAVALIVYPADADAATVVTYPKAGYTATSSLFSLAVDSTAVEVTDYKDYHYAHISFSGTGTFKVTSKTQAISTFDISPHSFGIAATKSGSDLTFTLTQGAIAQPYYLIVKINSLENLVILADPLESNVPASSGAGIYNIKNSPYNADSTGATLSTGAIQQAVNDASAAGGGTVYVPAGVYKLAGLFLKSNVNLYLAGGAVLRGSGNISDYTGDWAPYYTPSEPDIGKILPFIYILDASNVSVKGRGIIDTNGRELSPAAPTAVESQYRRNAFKSFNASNITVEGVIIKDATTWTVNMEKSHDLTLTNVKVINATDWKQNDGIDISSSYNAVVDKAFVYTGDDAYCAKANINTDNIYNVHFKNSIAWTNQGRGVKAGMQARSLMSDVWFENMDIILADDAGLSIMHDDGDGLYENLHFVDIRVEKVLQQNLRFEIIGTLYNAVNNVEVTRVSFEQNKASSINGKNTSAKINNVSFKGLKIAGSAITSLSGGNITANAHTSNITFKENVVTENFNGTATGSIPASWDRITSTTGSVGVAEVPSTTDKSVKINRTSTASGTRDELSTTFSPLSGKVTVEATVRNDSTTKNFSAPFILDNNGNIAFSLNMATDGNIKVYYGGAHQNVQTYASGTWYTFKIVLNTNTDKFDLYINNMTTPVVANQTFRTPVDNISKLTFFKSDANNSAGYVNTVKVY